MSRYLPTRVEIQTFTARYSRARAYCILIRHSRIHHVMIRHSRIRYFMKRHTRISTWSSHDTSLTYSRYDSTQLSQAHLTHIGILVEGKKKSSNHRQEREYKYPYW